MSVTRHFGLRKNQAAFRGRLGVFFLIRAKKNPLSASLSMPEPQKNPLRKPAEGRRGQSVKNLERSASQNFARAPRLSGRTGSGSGSMS